MHIIKYRCQYFWLFDSLPLLKRREFGGVSYSLFSEFILSETSTDGKSRLRYNSKWRGKREKASAYNTDHSAWFKAARYRSFLDQLCLLLLQPCSWGQGRRWKVLVCAGTISLLSPVALLIIENWARSEGWMDSAASNTTLSTTQQAAKPSIQFKINTGSLFISSNFEYFG